MTTEHTAQQLELAAQILRTGHPFEVRHDASDKWHASLGVNPAQAALQNWCLRPILATPPYPAQIHNPDNLTAEQVGVGYRLTVEGEPPHGSADMWNPRHERWARVFDKTNLYATRRTYRLPISVPWPEPVDPYAELKAAHAAGKRIQCKLRMSCGWTDYTGDFSNADSRHEFRVVDAEPAFQLPPPPPGMRWHREDGWKADDLPSGYRPLVDGENWVAGDEILRFAPHGWQIGGTPGDILDEPTHGGTSRCRTTRPLVFNHAGKTWTWHRPGDPMPCDGEARIEIVCHKGRTEQENNGIKYLPRLARNNIWEKTLGWRYADEKKVVPLGPKDVPPGSVLSLKPPRWFVISGVCDDGVYILDDEPLVESLWKWHYLAEKAQINRSIPLTGKWDPTAWTPCHKTISQNG